MDGARVRPGAGTSLGGTRRAAAERGRRRQRITSTSAARAAQRAGRAVAHATDLINALLEPEPDERLGARAGGLAELQAHPFFDGVDWAALAAGTAPSPLAALASHQLNELLPDGGDGQPNPELGIETEPCPAELLSADGEAERFDGLELREG